MSVNPDVATDAATVEPDFFNLRVVKKEAVAQGIYLFELRHPDGAPLPAFSAGSHLTVQVPSGVRRNYSLCSNPADTSAWQIAVKRDHAGRGGSVSMADDVHLGQLLSVSAPRNNFALAERAMDFIFVAGGIGITPILSMMRHLKSTGRGGFKLYYCTRDAAGTAFMDDIHSEFAGQVQIHHDNGDMGQALDLWPVFERPAAAHVYCCGPKGLMDSVADMSGHWPSGTVHFESFGVDAKAYAENAPFTVRLEKTGATLDVGAGQTLLEALRGKGLRVPSSCESGTCGSCKTGLLAGEAEHRDMVLSDEEKADHIMVCVSRAKSPELVLDL
ncbi:PDR/VanB family oxidoreductase [Polaromonas jejuensis]|uniref:PDR/VanB family oxidoreductase n=1 Tax=Polaromonas jejuensis TaxID=457502 RepID=A0ABW0QHI3_9BURK|nr:PDR/VanB family oxidoreductase [Polaromonas jejuensis]